MEAVQRGELTWDAFFHLTRTDWIRLSVHVYRRWRLPVGVTVEDVEQELKCGAFAAAARWTPGRSAFHAFVIWNAVTHAKKWIHTQRKALRRDGHAPSRIHIPFSEFEVAPEEILEAEQDEVAEQFARIGQALTRLDDLSQHVFVAILLARGDLDGAAEDVYDDKVLRRVLGLGSRAQAKRIVKRVAGTAIRAMAA
jgi:DNA-directed RNA polymerase specialized sigma24 family protein